MNKSPYPDASYPRQKYPKRSKTRTNSPAPGYVLPKPTHGQGAPLGQYGVSQQGPAAPLIPGQPVPFRPHQRRPPDATYVWDKYNAKGSRIVGYLQIVIASLSMVCGIVGIVVQNKRKKSSSGINREHPNEIFYAGAGIWGSFFHLITGILAIQAAKKKTTCPIVSTLVMSCVSGMFVAVIIATSAAALGEEYAPLSYKFYDRVYYPQDNLHAASVLMAAFLLVLSVSQAIMCLTTMCLSCIVLYAVRGQPPRPVMPGRGQPQTVHYEPWRQEIDRTAVYVDA